MYLGLSIYVWMMFLSIVMVCRLLDFIVTYVEMKWDMEFILTILYIYILPMFFKDQSFR